MKISEEQLKSYICTYIGKKLQDIEFNSEIGKKVFTDIGLNLDNLKDVLMLEQPYKEISSLNYTWNDVYGKSKTVDVIEYIASEKKNMIEELNIKKDDVLKKVYDFINKKFEEIKDFNEAFSLINIKENDTFYSLISHETEKLNYGYLHETSDKLYENIVSSNEEAKNVIGLLRKKENILNNLFYDIDDYLNQTYELLFYETINKTYISIQNEISKHNIKYENKEVPDKVYDILESEHLYDKFKTGYMNKYCIEEFIDKVDLNKIIDTINESDKTDNFDVVDNKIIDVQLIISAIQQKYLVVSDNYAFVYEYELLDDSFNNKSDTINLLMDKSKYLKIKRITGLKIKDKWDYDTLLNDQLFMNMLLQSKDIMDKNNAIFHQIEQNFIKGK